MKSPNPPGLRRLTCYLTAGLLCLSQRVRAEPCAESSVMREGAVASCSGVLVPGARVARLLERATEADACAVDLAAEKAARQADVDAASESFRLLSEALEAERAAVRTAETPESGFDWGALGLGLGLGLGVGLGALAVAVIR